jgi:FtsP/CotA-like multicopper oxidase with cupredoxin domain
LFLAQIVPAAGLLLGPWAVAAEPQVFELSIRGGELPEPSRVVRVRQGDDVTLRWTTDRPLTIHLHGYDLEEKLMPDKPVSMRLTARATGRFPIEIHPHRPGGSGTIAYLEVYPR